MSGEGYAAVLLYFRLGPAVKDSIESLVAQDPPPAQIILVDNQSNDGVLAPVACQWALVKLVELDENRGYAGGMNAGIASIDVSVDFILLVTHEVLLEPSCAARQISALRATSAAQAGPFLRRSSSGEIWSTGGRVHRTGRVSHLTHEWPAPRQVTWVDGACMMLRREALESVGGFEERFFIYWEDVDLSLRLACQGGTVIVPSASAEQDTNMTPPYYEARNRILIWRFHERRFRFLLSVASQVLKAGKDCLLRFEMARAGERLRGVAAGVRGLTGPRNNAGETQDELC